MQAPLLLDRCFPERMAARIAHALARRIARMRWSILAVLAVGVVLWTFSLIGIYSVARAMNPRGSMLGASVAHPERALIPGLPQFPGAAVAEFREELIGDERVTEIEYVVDSAVSAVQAHYREAFAQGGWAVTDTDYVHGEWVYTIGSGTRSGVVEIEHRDGVTEIEVELSEPLQFGDASSR